MTGMIGDTLYVLRKLATNPWNVLPFFCYKAVLY